MSQFLRKVFVAIACIAVVPILFGNLSLKARATTYPSDRSEESCRIYGTQSNCCEDVRMERPYFFEAWEQVLDILESLDRPWFASGGFALFAIRVGAFGFKNAENFVTKDSAVLSVSHKKWMSLLDGDMDFTVIFNDKEDQRAKYREITELCKQNDKLRCSANFPDRGTSVLWESTHTLERGKMSFCLWGAFRNGTHGITISDIANYDYDIPAFRILPTTYAKFHDSWIRVPRDFLWVFSHLRPYSKSAPANASVDTRNVEYGMGCWEMAYPSWLLQSADIPKNRPINRFPETDYYEEIRAFERGLGNCASCLARHGCASFISCLEH